MRKEQYIFLIIIFIILYLSYLIVSYKYTEYKVDSRITHIENTTQKLNNTINNYNSYLEYINTKAYKNKMLKLGQSMKNKGEVVVFITEEDRYNTYSRQDVGGTGPSFIIPQEKKIQDSMTIPQKWMYFLFQKDIR